MLKKKTILKLLVVSFTVFSQNLLAKENKPVEGTIENQWYHKTIETSRAWAITKGSPQIQVLVCDSGIESRHPDLVGNIIGGYNFATKTSETEPLPGLNHGTRTAGLIAAHGHGGTGLFGIAPNVQIIPGVITTKIVQSKFGPIGVATEETMAACVQYAIDHNIRIVNMSYFMLNSPIVFEKAKELHRRGGMLFVPAGNSGEMMPNPKSNDVVVVASTDPSDWLSMMSNRGPAIDMAAPGNAIVTTELGGGYVETKGTSNSAPLVAGAAALLLSMNPGAPIDEIIEILHSSAKDLGNAGFDTSFGYGRLDVGSAVEAYAKKLGQR